MKHFSTQLAKSLFYTVCFWLGLTTSCHSQVSTDPPLPLPNHAIWRFGSLEDTDSLGYYRLSFSLDGKFLAARNRENIVEIRDCESRRLICEIGGFESKVNWIDFSPDGEFLLTAGDPSENVKIWEVKSGKELHEIACQPTFAGFSGDGDSIVVLEKEKTVEGRRVVFHAKLLKYSWPGAGFIEHKDLRRKIDYQGAVSTSQRYLLANQRADRKVNLTKLIDLESDSSVILDGPSDAPDQVLFSPDENWLAATYARRDSVRLWSLHNPSEQKFELRGHTQTVKSIAFSHDSRFLATTGWDKRVVIWDLLTRESIGTLEGHSEHVVSSQFRPLHLQLATGSTGLNDSTVILWDLQKLIFSKPTETIDRDQFNRAWRGLGASEPRTALAYVNNLRFSIDTIFDLLKEKLAQPIATSREQIIHWIEKLDSKSFNEREQATQELKAVRGPAEQLLLEQLELAISTERFFRINEVLKQPAARPAINAAELRRFRRGIFLLELIIDHADYSLDSIQLLESLAQNHPHSDISRDAAAALKRIEFSRQSGIH